jgi:class 3 adenylate cyclase/tetratricopeptide (TPR) repeat protein
VAAGAVSDEALSDGRLRVTLLGPFDIKLGERSVGRWYRPPAKRLCELVLVSPGLRVGREVARDLLFAELEPAASATAISRALSLAREALSALGEDVAGRLRSDRAHIWFSTDALLDVDLVHHEEALRSALAMEPGGPRDAALSMALAEDGVLLEDEPYADWAVRPREALELVRQRARLELARDRARGRGRSTREAVIEAWEACLAHDATSEEAASSLMRVYSARGEHQAVSVTYGHCRAALEALGLRASPALEEARRAAMPLAPTSEPIGAGPPKPDGSATPDRSPRDERRLVSVLFAELSGPVGMGRALDPEDLRQIVGEALTRLIAEVEALGGTVTSVSGAGLAAIFGAPQSHEDDPERAVRAGFRIRSVSGAGGHVPVPGALSVRAGIETGPAVIGSLGAGYGAVGEVVGAAAALQSAAKASSVLVGPATRAATEGAFEWGQTEDVVLRPGTQPLIASYLERPKARPFGYRGRGRWAGAAPLVGRDKELAMLDEMVRATTSGTGSVLFIVGEPGLGKTRLVQESRKRFMAWVGAGTGRLPLWLEGRCASYASSTPYGLYQQLLSAWVGAAPEEGEEVVRSALERALNAVFGGYVDHVGLLAHMMGLRPGPEEDYLARLSPEGLQRATFAAIRALVAQLVGRGPTVLVLEDLHWADPTSLRLTEELATVASEGPLFLLATRRPEPDAGVPALESALKANPGCLLRRLELAPLPGEAERALARSLVGPGTGEAVIEAVCAGVEGNPLFLEERLSSLVETGALVRDKSIWYLSESAYTEIPEVLERLIRSRVDRLRPGSQKVITSASVLGPEFGLNALAAVVELEAGLTTELAELCATGLLAEVRQAPEPAYRFRHALIQEAIYGGMVRDQRRHLHARAAWGLEATSAERLEEVASVLGRHFAAAGEVGRAVHYFELAGDHALSVFANDEAISSYRSALAVVGPGRPPDSSMAKAAVQLRAKMANVLYWGMYGRYGEARELLHEAIGLVDEHDSFLAARLQNLLGRTEIENHDYGAALAAFDAAEAHLGDRPGEQDRAVVGLWVEMQLEGRVLLHYFNNEPDRLAAVLAEVGPVVQARGGQPEKQEFLTALLRYQLVQSRHRIDEEIIATAREALVAVKEGGQDPLLVPLPEPQRRDHEIGWKQYNLGRCLVLHGDLDEAEEALCSALATADRIGEGVLRLRCLSLLALTALRRHDAVAVAHLVSQVLEGPAASQWPEYSAMAKASLAWLAWHEGRFTEVGPRAEEALALWAKTTGWQPLHWICLWPLISVRLLTGNISAAVDASRQLLEPSQQRLPDELEPVVIEAGAAWDSGDQEVAGAKLAWAVELAHDLHYL